MGRDQAEVGAGEGEGKGKNRRKPLPLHARARIQEKIQGTPLVNRPFARWGEVYIRIEAPRLVGLGQSPFILPYSA